MNYERVPLAERFPKMESRGVLHVYGEILMGHRQGPTGNLNMWNPKPYNNGLQCVRKEQKAPTFIQIHYG